MARPVNVQSSTIAVEAIDCVDCGSDMDLDREGWLNRMYFGREKVVRMREAEAPCKMEQEL